MITIGEDPINRIYDEIRTSKLYIRKGMSCYTEFVEGIPVEKRRMLTTSNPNCMALDEWASHYRIDTSKLIELLSEATPVTKRAQKKREQLILQREYIQLHKLT